MNILKKFMTLAICATFILNNFQIAFAYPDYVAVISNYKDVKNGIQIHRANGPASGSPALLYPGDKITGNVGYVKIERGPHADFHNINNQYYLISYDPPSAVMEVVEKFKELVTIFRIKTYDILVDNGEITIGAISKGIEVEEFDLNPRPGFNPTLINNQKVIFAGVSTTDNGKKINPKNYAVKDSRGKEIYQGSFDENGETEIDLSTKNFKIGEKYTWVVDGNFEYDFRILDEKNTKIIQKYFDEIDAKNISLEQKNLEKAFWAQYLSDNSDGKIDLYWLSLQILTEISPKSADAQKEKYMMLQKYQNHLNDEFKRWVAGE